jgi:hypothetical protein
MVLQCRSGVVLGALIVGVWAAGCDDAPVVGKVVSPHSPAPVPAGPTSSPSVQVVPDRTEARPLGHALDPQGMRLQSGRAWILELPEAFAAAASDSSDPGRSEAVLTEDGLPLGPANASHAAIRADGGGAYSHWGSSLYLSSSDGSDPSTNGRLYELTLPGHEQQVIVAGRLVTGRAADYVIDLPADASVASVSLTLENRGDVPVEAPWLVHADGPDWFDVESMLAPLRDEAEDDGARARALWAFLVRHRDHDEPPTEGPDSHEPVRFLNAYGYGFCDDASAVFRNLGRYLGLETRTWWLDGHVVPEVFHDGGWHVYDVDKEAIYPQPAGLASVDTLARSPELALSPTGPEGHVPDAESRRPSILEAMGSFYASTDDNRVHERPIPPYTDMAFVLRPGERVERWWSPRAPAVAAAKGSPTSRHGSGRWTLAVTLEPDAANPSVTRFRLPYPIVAVEAELPAEDAAHWVVEAWPHATQDWAELSPASDGGEQARLRSVLAPTDRKQVPSYEVVLRARPASGSPPTERVTVLYRVDVQVAPKSLPALAPGANRFRYRARTDGQIAISHAYRLD